MQPPLIVEMSRLESLVGDERFEFGANWRRFLNSIDEERIRAAQESLVSLVREPNLRGKSFVDVGSGSGLFSLAALRLGARAVHSLDADPKSVACTLQLKARYAPMAEHWTIEAGSALHSQYMHSIGQFDVVYSWGVLHHTGAMWRALDEVGKLVAAGGKLVVSIYNDQGTISRLWRMVKRSYNRSPLPLRFVILMGVMARLWGPTCVKDMARGKPFASWQQYGRQHRGMAAWTNVLDWVGGYPFEVASPAAIETFYAERGFMLNQIQTSGRGHGCNEFVFSARA